MGKVNKFLLSIIGFILILFIYVSAMHYIDSMKLYKECKAKASVNEYCELRFVLVDKPGTVK